MLSSLFNIQNNQNTIKIRLDPRRRSTDMVSPQLGSSTEPAGQTKLITPKPVEAAMRPPTPLDQPSTPTATTPSSGTCLKMKKYLLNKKFMLPFQ